MKMNKRRVSDEIPTASMADVAFLLIVYFMVTSTFAATRGLDFAFPPEDDSQQVVEKEEAVLIEIQPNPEQLEILVDGKQMPLSQVADYLLPKLVNNPQKPIIIRPAPEAPYGHMVEVLDGLRVAETRLTQEVEGLDKLNISLPTQREIDLFWF
jgi:biopolymer transport protein ExbD